VIRSQIRYRRLTNVVYEICIALSSGNKSGWSEYVAELSDNKKPRVEEIPAEWNDTFQRHVKSYGRLPVFRLASFRLHPLTRRRLVGISALVWRWDT
jgi:hypothetical protein